MKSFRDLRFWLKHALWFVPSAYAVNFVYAVLADQSGGTFGDTFGAANALFSGTALLMLVLAVTLQREELEQVKEERNDTRMLLAEQGRINSLQKAAVERQIFEASFFSQFQLIIEEKRRLSGVLTNDEGTKNQLDDASSCAVKFVRNLRRDLHYEAPRGELKPMQEMRLLLRSILTLDRLLATAPIPNEIRDQYFKLMMSVVDFDIVACTAALTLPYRNHALSSDSYLVLYKRFNPEQFLNPKFLEDVEQSRLWLEKSSTTDTNALLPAEEEASID